LKKVMLLAAMLAMVLAVAVPALAQTAVVGQDCVQTAVNQETGKDQTAVSQYGDATNINIQAISQQCNVTVAQVSAVVASTPGVAASTAQYNAPAAAQYQYSASATASASASATASASASASTAPATELPSTGGSSLIALGAGVLLVAGGLLARRIVR
jgi:LPXTG-motif cell wall-anchored protein